MENPISKHRDATLDIIKGIAMIMVIMSHTLPAYAARSFAPFWSALFFVVSGYFAKNIGVLDYIKKGTMRLIIPYVTSCVIMVPLVFIGILVSDLNIWPKVIKSMALGSSSFVGDMADINIGPLWFICALFIVRGLWSLMCKIKNDVVKGVLILILAIIAWQAKSYVTLPWSILSAFGAMGFYYAGYLVKKYNLFEPVYAKKIIPIILPALFYCSTLGFTDINKCVYGGWYIIDIAGGIGAFFLLYAIIKHFSDISQRFWKFLNFVGRYSLAFFCFHAIDHFLNIHWFPFKFWWLFSTKLELVCALVLRVGIVAVGAYLVSKNKFLKEKIFFIKD